MKKHWKFPHSAGPYDLAVKGVIRRGGGNAPAHVHDGQPGRIGQERLGER